jgi:hypothetical protein
VFVNLYVTLPDYSALQLFWFVPTNKTTWLKYVGLEKAALKLLEGEEEPVVTTASIADPPSQTSNPTQEPLEYEPSLPNVAPGIYALPPPRARPLTR